ncbi:MAG TPA: pilus assembly protein PilP [Vicinamibacterales bacterium]
MVIPLLLLLGIVSAQAATPAPPPAESAAEESFTYDPGGRRDPFVSLLRSGSDSRAIRPAGAVDGLAGLAIADIAVRGVVKARDGYLAIVQAPDRKTYLARPGDRLLDGTVKAITPAGMVLLQEVSDPLSLVTQKEVRKLLRGTEEGK